VDVLLSTVNATNMEINMEINIPTDIEVIRRAIR
jgi:hypothetical protein